MIYNCILCQKKKFKIIYPFERIPQKKRIFKKKDIVKCLNCSLIYCWPRNKAESMISTYEKDYWGNFQTKVGERNIKFRIKEFENISKERINFIKKLKPSGKLLDVGCSQGFLVNEANNAGYDSYGIDLSLSDLNIGKKRYNIQLKKSLLQNYKNYNFDIITSYNVIEHVSFPDKFIREKRKRMKKNALLVIGTHDINCKNHRAEKENWKHIIPNEHLYYFSKHTLKKIVENEKFKLIKFIKPINNSIVGFFKCIK